MSGDYSRHTFDPLRHFSGVLMQQGRVQLDADWNELVAIVDRRLRAETADVVGRATVPKETADGFQIHIVGGTLQIGPGRMYVDGLLAENHGKPPVRFDALLEEGVGTAPVPYAEQPYLPNAATVAPLPASGGPHLVYLDAWQREVTALEAPELVEKAVGVDTTARLQTVWQVRVLPDVGAGATCATPDDQIPGWLDLTRPSAGRLTTAAAGVPSSTDPCFIPPSGGYRGPENRLYRVEIHDGGPLGTATFKWSRDNGSVAAGVTAVPASDTLTVDRTGRDPVLRFNAGDWVELTDDWREFAGQPGLMRRILTVDDATRTVTLTQGLPAGTFPVDAQGHTDPERHTRLRRWDQQGEIRTGGGSLLVDLNAPGSSGVIPVPSAGTSLILEDGVQITFHMEPAGGRFRVADAWAFAARTADASVEQLTLAPPRSTHHHYARLALVTFPATATDCRRLWPPEVEGAGCDCSVCVTAESHNGGTLTIQRAIDQVKSVGGTVCLGPGLYNLSETPVQIAAAHSVRVKGQGWKTQLVFRGPGAAIVVEGSLGIGIEHLALLTSDVAAGTNPSVVLRNSAGVTLDRCIVLKIGRGDVVGPAIGAAGILLGTVIRNNVLIAPIGIGNLITRPAQTAAAVAAPPSQIAPVVTAGLVVEDNLLFCDQRGISLEGVSLHLLETRLSGNLLHTCAQGGIVLLGWTVPGSGLSIQGNEIQAQGQGIVVGTDGARIGDNNISPVQAGRGGDGIVLASGLDPNGIERCQILGNRVTGIAGNGIVVRAAVRSAMITQNTVEGVGGAGILMDEQSSADVLSIADNQLLNIAGEANDPATPVVGLRLLNARQVDLSGNTLAGVGRTAVQSPSRVGLQIVACASVRVAGNDLMDIGPTDDFVKEAAGIDVLAPFDRLDVLDNVVRRSQQPPSSPGRSNWFALRIRGLAADATRVAVDDRLGVLAVGNVTVGLFGNRLRVLRRGREIVGVRGNLLEAYGAVPAVHIGGAGAFIFSENRCTLLSPGRLPVAVVTAGALISSGNYVQGPGDTPAMAFSVPQGPFTVLANVTSGPIQVNGATLGAPWAALNAIG